MSVAITQSNAAEYRLPEPIRELHRVLGSEGMHVDMDGFAAMPLPHVRLFRERYEAVFQGKDVCPGTAQRCQSDLAEYAAVGSLRNVIRANRLCMNPVVTRDLRETMDFRKLRHTFLPNQILFSDGRSRQDVYMEVDFLCHSRSSNDYVAFDFSLTKPDDETIRHRSMRVWHVSDSILQRPMALVDMYLNRDSYEMFQDAGNLFSMNMPYDFDYEEIKRVLLKRIEKIA